MNKNPATAGFVVLPRCKSLSGRIFFRVIFTEKLQMTPASFAVQGNIVDVFTKQIFYGKIYIVNGKIDAIEKIDNPRAGKFFVIPGFIDSHVHIESSMLVPSEFARLAVIHGTVGTVSDPHEIANVCGIKGVNFMIDNGKKTPFKFYFGAPSCVPATKFETAGASLNSEAVEELLQKNEIKYLSEMMNFPGVLSGEIEVLNKLKAAKTADKPVDGHAPGLRGEMAKKYIAAGISTDHECYTREEALEKITYGMKILIREGSAAKNFDALIDLLNDFPDRIMFCSDDKHPDSLMEGHINMLCARAIAKRVDLFKILRAACINPVEHYRLDVGLLREGDPADFIIVKDLDHFLVEETYINGLMVAKSGKTMIPSIKIDPVNNFEREAISLSDLESPYENQQNIRVIEALDGQLITNEIDAVPKVVNDKVVSDPENDILKIAVINRYKNAPVAIGFIRNFMLEDAAIASTVAHDSHNVIAVGTDDNLLLRAINLVIKEKGGISCVTNQEQRVLALPVAGLMSKDDGFLVAKEYTAIDRLAKKAGSTLSAPFMTLSFMALLVIPRLKLSDLGLFNAELFKLIEPV